jgi:hypothetical protein
MNQPLNQPEEPMSVEKMVHVSLCDARYRIHREYQNFEEQIRKSPIASVLGAVAAGCLLHRLPVRSILVTQARVISALVPPALFLFGAAKLYDYLLRRQPSGVTTIH